MRKFVIEINENHYKRNILESLLEILKRHYGKQLKSLREIGETRFKKEETYNSRTVCHNCKNMVELENIPKGKKVWEFIKENPICPICGCNISFGFKKKGRVS